MKKSIVALLLLIEALIGSLSLNNMDSRYGEISCEFDALAVSAHNAMFDSYVDKTVKGKAVKELVSKIAAYNQNVDENFLVTIAYRSNNEIDNENAIVLVDSNGIMGERLSIIGSSKNYEVTGELTSSTGIYNKIIVTLVKQESMYSDKLSVLDELSMQAHNAMFDSYMDKTVKGKAVKELIAKMSIYNKTGDEKYAVTIIVNNKSVLNNTLIDTEQMANIQASKNYMITGEMDYNTGIINKIIVILVDE